LRGEGKKTYLFFEFYYLFERESKHEWGEEQRERRSRLPAEQETRHRTRSQDPKITTRAEGRHLTN